MQCLDKEEVQLEKPISQRVNRVSAKLIHETLASVLRSCPKLRNYVQQEKWIEGCVINTKIIFCVIVVSFDVA
jgi:hypothetical protein